MWGWLWGRRPQRDDEALRAHFLLNECDGFEGVLPTEGDFQAWLEQLDPDGMAFAEDMGRCSLERLSDDNSEQDFWDVIGVPEGRAAWGGYQRANQGWGAVQWIARAASWFHGLPWF